MARRGGYDPFGLFLRPSEFFRMSPFSLIRRMTEEMDRVFGEAETSGDTGTVWLPAVEVTERDGNYVVRAELPGLKPENVAVEVADNALVIQGELRAEEEQDRGTVHRSERRYGRFYRAIPLPEGAKTDQAKAKFENGVLEVTIPVPQQQTEHRRIPIAA